MKNQLIKIMLLILVSVLLISESFALVIGPNIKVKLDSSGNETYSTALEGVSNNNTILNFEIVAIYTGTSTGSYSMSFPTGFEAVSSSILGTTCDNQAVTVFNNTNFSYNINPTNQDCVSRFILSYKVTPTTITGDYKINIIDTVNGTEVSNLDIGITSLNSLINAETIDTNANGYIDTYKLVFNTSSLTNFSNIGLTIGTLIPTFGSISGDTVYLTINDSTYKTGEKPNINHVGNIFDGIGNITDVIPTDKAAPILETINGLSIASDINITGDGDLVLVFSEELFPTSNDYIFLQKDGINISSTNTFTALNTLIINPDSTLAVGDYSIVSISGAKDWSSNPNSLNIAINTLIVSDSTAPTGYPIGESAGISINSGNSETNNTSVQLSLNATDNVGVVQMKIGNLVDLSDGEWENYNISKLNHDIVGTLGTNTVYVKFRDNNGNESLIYSDSIEYNNTNDYVLFDNISSIYTLNNSITVTGLCNFTGAVTPNLMFKNGASIISGTCASGVFSNTYSLVEGQNTLEAYFDGTSILGSINIYKDTTAPILSITPVESNNSSQITVDIASDDVYDIYFTTDGTVANTSSNIFSSSFTLNENKTINYYSEDQLGNNSSGTKSYTFTCTSISNGTVSNYPTCTLTCNSGYAKSGNTCVAISSGGGGSSGGTYTDYENIKYISKTKVPLTELIVEKTIKKYGILDISEYGSKELTGVNGIINLSTSFKGLSKLIINEDTSIVGNAELLYAPYSLEIKGDLKVSTIKVNNLDIPSYNIKKLYFAGNIENIVSFNKEINLEFNMGTEIDGEINAYYSDNVDGNFTLIKSGLTTNENGLVGFKSNKLGYFVFIRDIYANRYFSIQTSSTQEINTNLNTKKLVTELKIQVVNKSLYTLIDSYSDKLIIPEIEYYISFDQELYNKYNNVVNGYRNFIINLDRYITTKDTQYQIAATNGYKEYLKVSELKDFDEKYIIKTWREGLEIYKTTYTPIVHLVDALEDAMLIKLKKLLNTNSITQEQYHQTIRNYNEFILHLSIYRQYKNKAAAYKALTPGRAFLKVYKMNIVLNSPVTKEIIKKILIRDKYEFSLVLQFGSYNIQVQNLQEIMKSYGYFSHPATTYYFGNVTKEAYSRFAPEVLGLNNTNGVLTYEAILKLNLIEYKD